VTRAQFIPLESGAAFALVSDRRRPMIAAWPGTGRQSLAEVVASTATIGPIQAVRSVRAGSIFACMCR